MEKIKYKEFIKMMNQGEYILEFYTEWCTDCKMMKPIIEKVEAEVIEKNLNVKFLLINPEEAGILRTNDKFNVTKIPSFFHIKNNVINHLGLNYIPEEVFRKKINDALNI